MPVLENTLTSLSLPGFLLEGGVGGGIRPPPPLGIATTHIHNYVHVEISSVSMAKLSKFAHF